MSDINPVEVEKTILEIVNEISHGIITYRDALARSLAANREYTLAYARAYMAFDGPAHARRFAADLATEGQLVERDAGEVALRFADRSARALEKKLDAFRSIGASVRQAYGQAGRGEW